MNLQVVNYPTPQGKTCDVVDADRDGGEGQPLIVARFFEPEYAKAFVALPGLLAACREVLAGAEQSRKLRECIPVTLGRIDAAVAAAGVE